ncbi:conserved protein of unknown function precursor containing a T9SS type A C-terminal secretion signal [Tenacibaculum sp. 190524A02b]|uniref:lamin tail domain-containing protein n=1 Tax=Tenacibaculum vairaonense TaxID=3137860 RepID=UPI0032B1267B
MKKKYLLLLVLLTTSLYSQEVVINEIQSKNLTTYRNSKFEYSDWIEFKNITSNPIDISDYYLSDDPDNIKKWKFPSGISIPANGLLLIDVDGTNSWLSTNFKLSASGETLVFSKNDETEIQRIEFPEIQKDISYGRKSDGAYTLLSKPTPHAANDEASAFTILDSKININIPSGLYDTNQTVEITFKGEGTLYYTLDGTEPTTSTTAYSGPITIGKSTILKSKVIKSASEYSITENRSYIIGASHDLPVILLTSDNSSKNSGNKEVIDGRVEFIFIEKDGTVAINQYASFRASGKTSRGMPQLNGKVEADAVYGDKDFDYKMFPNKELDEFRSFLLRNSSQDWAETHLRDAFVSRVLSEDNLTDFPFEGYRPAALYVNGKYQGIINVREDDDNSYIKDNYGLKTGEFEKNGRDPILYTFTTDRAELDKILNFNHHVNVQFLISYAELNEYGFGSWKDLSGKTPHQNHYFMHDYDATFGLRGFEHVPLTNAMSVNEIIPSEMRAHEPYKTEGLQLIAALINHVYNKDRTLKILDAMEKELESEIPAHAIANVALGLEQGYDGSSGSSPAPFANLTEWKANIAALRKDVEKRIDANIFTRIKNAQGIEDPIQVTYESSNINRGFIRVHNVKSIKETFTGTYFSNIPIKFSAEALPGYKFVRWEGAVNSTDENITPTFTTNTSLKAVFEPIAVTSTNLVINEVQGKNDTTITDEAGEYDDWIEIYNPNSTPVNLAGYYISDKLSEPLKWKIPDTDASKTTVPANGFLLLWADKDLEQGANHLDFKLKGTDQVILTAPDATTKIQEISFTDIDTGTSYGAKVDGDADYITFTIPTPGATNGNVLSTDDIDVVNNKIGIYPNPTTNNITIQGTFTDLKWKLFNLNGQLIKSGTDKKIYLDNVSTGLYFLNINNKKNLKVIKQ